MAKSRADETKAGAAVVENACVSAASGTENAAEQTASAEQNGGAGVSAAVVEPKREGPRERLEGPPCPKCKKTNTRVARTMKTEPDRAYPAFMGMQKKVRYYKCGDCEESFKA